MLKPPGEALTKLNERLLLWDLSLPAGGDLTDYVIYDADGHDYGHSTLEESKSVLWGRLSTTSSPISMLTTAAPSGWRCTGFDRRLMTDPRTVSMPSRHSRVR